MVLNTCILYLNQCLQCIDASDTAQVKILLAVAAQVKLLEQ